MKSYLFKVTTHAPIHDTHHRTIYSDDFNKAVLAVAGEAYPFGLKAIEFQLEYYIKIGDRVYHPKLSQL